MRHIGPTKANEAWQIERLVQQGPDIGIATNPLQTRRKFRVEGKKRHRIAFISECPSQHARLDPLAAEGLQAGRYECNPGPVHGSCLVRVGVWQKVPDHR